MATLKFFAQCKTKQEVKATFRELAKKYHPDVAGEYATETIKTIINEYETVIKTLPSEKVDNSQYNNMSDEQFSAHITAEMQQIINSISHLPIEIEIIGTWLWVKAEAKYKSYLTAHNMLWSPNKKMYYWRLERDSAKGYKRKSKKSIDEIRDTYGSNKVNNNERTYITA